MKQLSASPPRIADIVAEMEKIAPPTLAESWDNCGLQLGSPQWPVHKIWVALDPAPEVIAAAAEQNTDLLITHHPLFFNPIRSLNMDTPAGRCIEKAIVSRLAIYTAHTNLDSALNGVNCLLANKLGMVDSVALIPAKIAGETQLRDAARIGMGRIGELERAMPLSDYVRFVKSVFQLEAVKVTGNLKKQIVRIAVCSGSGGSLIETFLQTNADVFVSGDIRYHDARTIESEGRGLIDIGHFASEHIIVGALADALRERLEMRGFTLVIEPCRIERDPFALM